MKRVCFSILLLAMLFSLVGWAPLDNFVIPPFVPNPYPLLDRTFPPPDGDGQTDGDTNPLTGLPVDDPDLLLNPPALLSITNWPVSARPQAGLSYVSMVYELYIGDGESRFLSLFYGDYPPEVQDNQVAAVQNDTAIGPLRSARLPYEPLRQSYSGFLVMASGFKGVLNNLSDFNNFFGTDSNSITSAFVDVTELKQIASASDNKVDPIGLGVNVFESSAPAGGLLAPDFWFIYNAFNQIHWQYDASSEAYLRYQDLADGQTFIAASDRLNGETLTFENVIVLFADHRYCTKYAFEIDLLYQNKSPALLFRDGKVYEIFWTTMNTEYEQTTGRLRPIRFIDADGNPFAMKPGQTWVHLVPSFTPYWETTQASDLFSLLNKQEPGSGKWVSRFYESLMTYDEAVCKRVR